MKLITSNLLEHLQQLSKKAETVSWITAFAMTSGVKVMLPTFQQLQKNGCTVQLLVGDYLSITQPDALQLLIDHLPQAEIRMYRANGQSFHPKAYLFRHAEERHVIVGSSNLSKSAMTAGIEWNLHTVDEQTYEQASDAFQKLFYAEQTVPVNTYTIAAYRKVYEEANKTVPFAQKWDEEQAAQLMYGTMPMTEVVFETQPPFESFQPRPAQQLALNALQQTIDQGYDKAMVVMATGLGKTYVAAFFSKSFRRILFVAHREEILQQAKAAFIHLYPHKIAGFYTGDEKNKEAEMVFASIYTLGQLDHLKQFERDAFDLVVVDEFHHAAAPTYERLIHYFQPQFLLGITATPDRLDNKDVYALTDGNVAFELHFLEAIAHNWLAPFHYYAVKDDIDYSQIRWLGTRYDDVALTVQQLQREVVDKVFSKWQQLKQTRTIAFCASVKQAQFLHQHFSERSVHSAVLTGNSSRAERQLVREQLEAGQLMIVFTVDLFNEGVDIPTVDTLLFIRPTESLTIFTQQVGRGLRLAQGKEKCVIIDFIGNYRNADRKLSALHPALKWKGSRVQQTQTIDGTDVVLHFDLEVIDLLQEIVRKQKTFKQNIIDLFLTVKEELGMRPTYVQFYLNSGYEELKLGREFGSYIHLLSAANELSEDEARVFERFEQLLMFIEQATMQRSYKMVLLQAMLKRGTYDWYKPITAEEAVPHFITFFSDRVKQQVEQVELHERKLKTMIKNQPMKHFGTKSDGLVQFDGQQFSFNIIVERKDTAILFDWVQQLCAFKLHSHFQKKYDRLQRLQ